MKIGFDATSLCRKKTGIEYYTLNLIKSLLRFDRANLYVIFFRKEIPSELEEFRGTAKFIVSPFDNQIFCEQVWLPYIALKEKADLVHFPAFPPALLTSKKYILTIHDATIWKFPDTLSWKGRYYLKPLTAMAALRAARIVTVSESSKRDIAQCARIPADKIVNAGEAIGEGFEVIEDKGFLESIRTRYTLPKKYILSVGSIEPRKNLSLLLDAYKQLRSDPAFADCGLVLTGRKAWGNDLLLNKIRELKLEKNVHVTGYVPEKDLDAIYNMAEIFVFPSYYEGFGLPPLEAMACGAPVIASNASSLPEVLGDAAIFIDPHNAGDLAERIKRIMQDEGLRKELRTKGFARSKIFYWEDTAKKIMDIYRSLSSEK